MVWGGGRHCGVPSFFFFCSRRGEAKCERTSNELFLVGEESGTINFPGVKNRGGRVGVVETQAAPRRDQGNRQKLRLTNVSPDGRPVSG